MEEELRALKGHSTSGIVGRVESLTDICCVTYPGKRSQPTWWSVEFQRLGCCLLVLIRLKGRARMLTGLLIDPILMIIKGKLRAQKETPGRVSAKVSRVLIM